MDVKKSYNRGWLVLAATIIMFLVFTGLLQNAQALLLVPVTTDLGISRTVFSTLMSVTGLVNMGVSFFYSQLIGKIGLKRIIIFGCLGGVGYCAFFVLAGMFPSAGVVCIAIAQILLGLTCSWAALMSASILINNWFAKRSGLLIGIVIACGGLGGTIGAPLVSWLILSFGWQTDVFVRCIVALVATIIVTLLIKDKPGKNERKVWAEENTKENTIEDASTIAVEEELSGISFTAAKKTKNFWFAILTIFFISFCIYPSIMVMAAYATDIGYATAAGLVMTVIYGSNIIASTPMGGIIEKLGNRLVLTICLLLFVGSLVLLSLPNLALPLLFVTAVVIGIGFGLIQVPVPLLTKEIFGLKDFPRIQSYLFVASVLGCTISLPIYNFGFDMLGSYQPMFMITIPLVVLTIAFLFICTGKQKKA